MKNLRERQEATTNFEPLIVRELSTSHESPETDLTKLGSYQLIERIGEGGMGEVFQAVHIGLGRVVALKRIRSDKLQTPSAIKRFVREVRAAARVDHPNIVRAYDANSEGDSHYLVMEFIDGTDLLTLVKKNGPLPVEEILRVALEIGLALKHLHTKGLVHRDIKPSNLIRVRSTGVNKLMDLGLARMVKIAINDSLAKSMTLRGTILGTPDYMAPEQVVNAKKADIRSDLYSLGCTLYFLLTGSVPFPTPTAVQKLMKQIDETPASILLFRPNLPPQLVRFVERLMSKSPENRPQTPSEMLNELREFTVTPLVETISNTIIGTDSTAQSEKESADAWERQFRQWLRKNSTIEDPDLNASIHGGIRKINHVRMLIATAIIVTAVSTISLILLAL